MSPTIFRRWPLSDLPTRLSPSRVNGVFFLGELSLHGVIEPVLGE